VAIWSDFYYLFFSFVIGLGDVLDVHVLCTEEAFISSFGKGTLHGLRHMDVQWYMYG